MENKKMKNNLYSLIAAIAMVVFSVSICVFTTFSWFSQNNAVKATGMSVSAEYSNYLKYGTTFNVKRGTETKDYTNNNGVLSGFAISGILPNETLKLTIPLVNSSDNEINYTLSFKNLNCGDKSKADDENDTNGWFSVTDEDGNVTYHNVLGVYRFRVISYETDGDKTEIEEPSWTWLSSYDSSKDDEIPESVEIFNGTTNGASTSVTMELQFSVDQFASNFSVSTNVLSTKIFSVGTLLLSSEVAE